MRILMASMSLGIGGAETHIVELSKELARRGHTVFVASAGGSYVAELEKCGIKHYALPLNVKRPDRVLKSYFGLLFIIRRENIELIHSHARISSFIAGAAAKHCGIKFVTTCHGVYEITEFWRRLSNWGAYSLAVSYDIKQYLIKNYDFPRDNILLTINGIDTERFSPRLNPASEAIFDEFKLDTSCRHRVIYVSRIDVESGHIAFQLVHSAKKLLNKYADLEIVIIGSGTSFEALKREAAEVNRQLCAGCGREIITLCGARTDICEFLNLGNYESDGLIHTPNTFIGVSRSALEAMSSGLPTVLAGSQGALGLFDSSKLSSALDTNFCCRDCGSSSDELVFDELCAALSLSEADRDVYGMYNRSVVMDNYSISRMADDAETIYSKPFRRPGKRYDYIISGYYGFGNTGDDSLLSMIVTRLFEATPDCRILVLSKNPRKTEASLPVKAVRRFNIPSIMLAMSRSSVLVNGGGSLLQNSTSTRSLFYYTNIIRLAHFRGLKIMLYGSGIGPINGKRAEKMTKIALERCDLITLRDENSAKIIEKLGVNDKNIILSADPAFASKPADPGWVTYALHLQTIMKNHVLSCDLAALSKNVSRETNFSLTRLPYFCVSLRNTVSCKIDADFFEKLVEALCNIANKYSIIPLFLPMQNEQDYDINYNISKIVKKKLDIRENIFITGLSASEICTLVANMRLTLSMRLHLLIYSASVATPIFGFDCDPKLSGLVKTLDQPYISPVYGFSREAFLFLIDKLLVNSSEISLSLKNKTSVLRNKALKDGCLTAELLEDCAN